MDIITSLFPNGMWHYAMGGLLIGAGVSLLYLTTGLQGGASSFFSSTLSFFSRLPYFQSTSQLSSRGWRLIYALGMVLGAALIWQMAGLDIATTELPAWQLMIGGFIAGFGARLGNGCTSGHGICGIASFDFSSVLAVVVFLSVAILTAQLMTEVLL